MPTVEELKEALAMMCLGPYSDKVIYPLHLFSSIITSN